MKRFLKTLKEKMTAYEVFLILISAIVGAVFSSIAGLDIEISIYICIGIIAFFLIATIIIQWLVDRFNVLHIIKKFNKNKQYNLSIALGTNLSLGLWHTYRLNLRLKIGEQVKKASEESLKSAPQYKQYELKYILANTYIDDLGYTNYILNNAEKAYENICARIKIIDELNNQSQISSHDILRFKELKLKAMRHEMGMLDSIGHFIGGEEKVKCVRNEFKTLFEELVQQVDSSNSDASLCAEYAVIKDKFLQAQAKQNSTKESEAVLIKLIDLRDRINQLEDKARRIEWDFKCLRLKWEIQLFIKQDVVKNYEELFYKISQPEDKTINRFLDIYKRFLLYSQYLIEQIDVSNEDAKLHIKKYKANWKQAKKQGAEFLLGCEAKKQVQEIDKLNKKIKTLLKEKSEGVE